MESWLSSHSFAKQLPLLFSCPVSTASVPAQSTFNVGQGDDETCARNRATEIRQPTIQGFSSLSLSIGNHRSLLCLSTHTQLNPLSPRSTLYNDNVGQGKMTLLCSCIKLELTSKEIRRRRRRLFRTFLHCDVDKKFVREG